MKDKPYAQHLKALAMDRPKEFSVREESTSAYVARWCQQNGLRHYQQPDGRKVPQCKRCGAPCQFYSPHARFSVKCEDCNALHNKKARARRNRNKAK